MTDVQPGTMKALRLHSYGEALDVLHLEEAAVPSPGPGQVRVRVHACALNPADGLLCRGFMPGMLPRGIGLDVSGTVDAVGEGVLKVSVGDLVFGVPDFLGQASAGAADYAILAVFEPVPESLSLLDAATLPMAVETAARSLGLLGAAAGQTIFINGGGTMMGFAAVQMALLQGAHVVTSAGETYADRLRALGAKVTPYGDGMVERVRALAGRAPDMVLQTALAPGVLPDLIRLVDGDPSRVLSITDFDSKDLGVRTSGQGPGLVLRYDALAPFARLAAQGRFSIPIARTFRLENWREALEISLSGRARGKLLLLPAGAN